MSRFLTLSTERLHHRAAFFRTLILVEHLCNPRTCIVVEITKVFLQNNLPEKVYFPANLDSLIHTP